MRRCFSSLVAAACLASAASAASDRVLVVGAHASLVHDAVATASQPPALARAFSPAGLAQLAMDALGLPTGSVSQSSSGSNKQLVVESPVQADVFSHVKAYAMVFVDSAEAAVLDAVDKDATSGYHMIFDLTSEIPVGSSPKIPAVIARGLKQAVGVSIQCAGSEMVCTRDVLSATVASASELDVVLKEYSFLDRTVNAEIAVAQELAQVRALTASIAANKNTPSAFYAVSFGSLSGLKTAKQTQARSAVAKEIKALLAELQTTYPTSSGAQVVATNCKSSFSKTVSSSSPKILDSVIAYSRMLLSFDEKIGSSSDEDDSDDEDDDDDSDTNSTKSDVDINDIAEYQIVLWTSVLLGAVLLLVIITMCNMDNKRDSLLYAKFTTSNGSRKFD